MSEPNWRQFAAIEFDWKIAAVIKALDLQVPAEGRPRTFRGPRGHAGAFLASVTTAGGWVVSRDGHTMFVNGPDAVLRAAKLPVGTPSGDALRQWLGWWGWTPKSGISPIQPLKP